MPKGPTQLLHAPTRVTHAIGLDVFALAGDRSVIRLDAGVLPLFRLPRSLPGR